MQQVKLLRHISTFDTQPRARTPSLTNLPAPAPNVDLTSVSAISADVADPSACAPSAPISEQRLTPSDDPEDLRFPDDRQNHGLCINRTWVDTHASLLRTDRGLHISVRGIKDKDVKRPHDAPMTRSKVAKTDRQIDAASASHAASGPYEVQDNSSVSATALDDPDEEAPEDETPEEALMDDRKPDISLIDLPHSNVIPTEYLWRQCAVFMEMRRHARDGPLTNDPCNAQRPEDANIGGPHAQVPVTIVAQMADNARILMATRPFLRFCLHITFCGTDFNLALFDRNGVIISRVYDFKIHLRLFIRIIRRLSCDMTAYDLGLDTTVRPEGCLGSAQYPPYLVKISAETWYRTEGVPLWQSTSLLGRGTLVFNAREHSRPTGPLWILKNAWREDGRLKESGLYESMQKPGDPFQPPKALAKYVVGGDVPLREGENVTIKSHRALFDAMVIGYGATLHRLVLASRGRTLASYSSLKELLAAALHIVLGMNFIYRALYHVLISLPAHKGLHDQGILHGDISYGNAFLSAPGVDGVHGFLADLDLASLNDEALEKLPEDTAKKLRQQREKGPRSVCEQYLLQQANNALPGHGYFHGCGAPT